MFVSELCLGAMTFGGKGFWETIGKLDASQAEALIGTSLDAGVNFIDTADVYSEGESEKLVGAASGHSGVCATRSWSRPRSADAWARGRIKWACRARTSWPRWTAVSAGSSSTILTSIRSTESTERHRSRRPCDRARRRGPGREGSLRRLLQLARVAGDEGARLRRCSWLVPVRRRKESLYSIAGRDIEREVVPMAEDQGLAILPWSPLARGLLSGKFDIDAGTADTLTFRRSIASERRKSSK